MDYGPLVTEEINAGVELIHKFQHYAPIKVAFWLRDSDDDHRYLCLSSDQFNDSSVRDAYGEVIRLFNEIDSPFLHPMRVKIFRGNDPVAMAATEINEQSPNKYGTRINQQTLGNRSVGDAYVYPMPIPSVVIPYPAPAVIPHPA